MTRKDKDPDKDKDKDKDKSSDDSSHHHCRKSRQKSRQKIRQLNQELTQQQQLIAEQNQILHQLHTQVVSIKEIGIQINNQLDHQSQILTDLGSRVDDTQGDLQKVDQKVKTLTRRRSNCSLM